MEDIDYTGLTAEQINIINTIINDFDFKSVKQYMNNTNWKWSIRTNPNSFDYAYYNPTINDIKHKLTEYLIDGFKENNKSNNNETPIFISAGGFSVYVWPNNECQVYFSVTDYFYEID